MRRASSAKDIDVMPQVSQQPSRKAKNKKKDDNNIEPSTNGANKEEVKCCNLCGNIYITKESFVTHMKTDHSIFEMKKKISPSNGFEEYYDLKLPNKVNDELVETLKNEIKWVHVFVIAIQKQETRLNRRYFFS